MTNPTDPPTPSVPNPIGSGAPTTDPLTRVGATPLPPSDAVVCLRVYGGTLELLLAPTKHAFTLGSGLPTQVDLPLPVQYVSRLHATLDRQDNWIVVTNRSQNGTYFGGRREPRSPVKAGELFTVGQTELLALDDHLLVLRGALVRALGFSAHRDVDRALVVVADGRQPPLLLSGPRGSEQERLAEAIHRSSPRRALPFEMIDPATPRVAIEAALARAGNGTVFVDLRLLRDRKASGFLVEALFGPGARARIVVAAPTAASAQATLDGRGGKLEEICTPAASTRPAEIPMLLNMLLIELGTTRRLEDLPPDRVAAMCEFDWPDNHEDLRRSASRLRAFLEADGNFSAAARAIGTDDGGLGVALERIGAIVRGKPRKR